MAETFQNPSFLWKVMGGGDTIVCTKATATPLIFEIHTQNWAIAFFGDKWLKLSIDKLHLAPAMIGEYSGCKAGACLI